MTLLRGKKSSKEGDKKTVVRSLSSPPETNINQSCGGFQLEDATQINGAFFTQQVQLFSSTLGLNGIENWSEGVSQLRYWSKYT